MIKIAVVDDEKKWQAQIGENITNYFSGDVEINCFESGEAFLDYGKHYEIVFMDIELGARDGFSISDEYKKKYPDCLLMIATTHIELSNQGYKVNAFRYLDKLNLQEIEEALSSACNVLKRNKTMQFHLISLGDIEIAYKDIVYIENAHRKIVVVTHSERLECTGKMASLVAELLEEGFCDIHRSFLVNLDYVKKIINKEVTMSNEAVLPIGTRKVMDFKAKFMAWKFRK